VPPEPGAHAQVCLPVENFQLIDEHGGVSEVSSPRDASGEVSGSIDLTAGTWTGMSEGSIEVGGLFGAPIPPGTSYGLACPWSLTLTPAGSPLRMWRHG
jgi:hypothetical protein